MTRNVGNMNSLVSIIVPTKNSGEFLEECLSAIRKQTYKNIEILVVDGGSTDKTLAIAQKYKTKIFHNQLVLAEPGVDLGFKNAQGDFCVILAADNILGSSDWLEKMIKPFADKNVFISYPKQCPPDRNFWINKYLNFFTDPVNHFIYGYAANTRTFSKIYPVLKKTEDYVIYKFSPLNHPMIALAQGTMIRKSYKRPASFQYDDIMPIIDIIEKGYKLAYVSHANLIHKSVSNLAQFARKVRWGVDNVLKNKEYGYSLREKYISRERKVRKYLFLPYALSIVAPVLNSIYHLIIDQEITWIYHPFIVWLTTVVILQEMVRVKILRNTSCHPRA